MRPHWLTMWGRRDDELCWPSHLVPPGTNGTLFLCILPGFKIQFLATKQKWHCFILKKKKKKVAASLRQTILSAKIKQARARAIEITIWSLWKSVSGFRSLGGTTHKTSYQELRQTHAPFGPHSGRTTHPFHEDIPHTPNPGETAFLTPGGFNYFLDIQ